MNKPKRSSKSQEKGHAIELSAKAALFWGLCLFFLLAWTFVLGIFVGRGFVPDGMQSISMLKARIAKLQGLIGHEDSPRPATPEKSFEDPKMAFYENLSTKKKAVARKQLSPSREEKPKRPAAPREANVKNETGQEQASVHTDEKYTVQIASLTVQEKAKGFVDRLTAKGYPAYSHEVNVKGSPRYRVLCGSFKTVEDAKGFARELFKAEKIRGFVLRVEK
jgi:SPOR domain